MYILDIYCTRDQRESLSDKNDIKRVCDRVEQRRHNGRAGLRVARNSRTTNACFDILGIGKIPTLWPVMK